MLLEYQGPPKMELVLAQPELPWGHKCKVESKHMVLTTKGKRNDRVLSDSRRGREGGSHERNDVK